MWSTIAVVLSAGFALTSGQCPTSGCTASNNHQMIVAPNTDCAQFCLCSTLNWLPRDCAAGQLFDQAMADTQQYPPCSATATCPSDTTTPKTTTTTPTTTTTTTTTPTTTTTTPTTTTTTTTTPTTTTTTPTTTTTTTPTTTTTTTPTTTTTTPTTTTTTPTTTTPTTTTTIPATTTPTTTTPPPTTTILPTTPPPPTSTSFVTSTTSMLSSVASVSVCGVPGSYFEPDVADCSSFTRLVNGVDSVYRCAAGMVYNPDMSVCVWPESYPACSNSTTSSVPLTTADPSVCLMPCPTDYDTVYPLFTATSVSCGEYYVCQGGQLFTGNCADIDGGLYPIFDSSTRSCVADRQTMNLNCPP